MMPLKVLHVLVPEPPGELGGADMHVRDLCIYQKLAGLEVTVAERGSSEFALTLQSADINVLSFTDFSFAKAVRSLAHEISLRRPDVVHAHGYDADYWATAVRLAFPSLFRRTRLVFTQHGVVEDTLWHRLKTLLDAMCARFADGIIVCSPDLIVRMRKWCPHGYVQFISNGVSTPERIEKLAARATLDVAQDAFVIGYIGRLSAEKRPDRVLALVADAHTAGLNVHAVIAGSGPLRADLEAQAVTLGICNVVTFSGLVRDIGVVYSAIDLLVLLSDTETTSRVVLEAMGIGVPVLASDVGGISLLLEHGRLGRLVRKGDAEAAKEALKRAVSEPGRYVMAARHAAKTRYLAAHMGGNVSEFYETLLTFSTGTDKLPSPRQR